VTPLLAGFFTICRSVETITVHTQSHGPIHTKANLQGSAGAAATPNCGGVSQSGNPNDPATLTELYIRNSNTPNKLLAEMEL
jgi:hypothetical protein